MCVGGTLTRNHRRYYSETSLLSISDMYMYMYMYL